MEIPKNRKTIYSYNMRSFRISKKKIISLSLLAILAFICILAGCSLKEDDSTRLEFKHHWYWTQGADDGSAPEKLRPGQGVPDGERDGFHLLDVEQENDLESLLPDEKGYIWIYAEFQIPEALKNTPIGLFSNRILYAGDIFINGYEIGQLGTMPPYQFLAGFKASGFYIPDSILKDTGKHVLSIKIWVEGVGSVPSTIYLDNYDKVLHDSARTTFLCSTINFSFAFSLVVIALFYLFLYSQRKFKEYLLHAMLNLCSAVFLSPFFQDQFTFVKELFPSYLVFCKFFYAIPAYISAYFASSYMREFLHETDSKSLKITRLVILILPIIITLAIPDLVTLLHAQSVLILFISAQIYFGVESVCKSLIRQKKEVYVLISGFSPVLIAIPIDIIVHSVLKADNWPYLTILGWQGVILAFMFILTIRYNEIFKRVEYLNSYLEREIDERTHRLTESNEKLESERRQAQADMNFAVHVQEAFFKQPDFTLSGWDLAMTSMPASGISGDMFDVYHVGTVLEGMSLFDVSGHGIAAGLVTMLCKNIIGQTFRDGLYSGETHEDLGTVMENINRGVINAKGDIENYLTGVVLRLDNAPEGETCRAELTNAGSPVPLLYVNNTQKCVEIKTRTPSTQYGMIGIRGLEVSFPSQQFEIAPEDALVLYTDGVIEAVNSDGEQFGRERLAQAIAEAGSVSANAKLNYILKKLKTFAGDVPYDDDITLIVLQRKKNASDDIESLIASL